MGKTLPLGEHSENWVMSPAMPFIPELQDREEGGEAGRYLDFKITLV